MPKNKSMNKVLVIGSGPIVIGQAAEFDYAGTQACRALRDEGFNVVLVNPNPATIMTDVDTAHRVYMEPLTLEFLTHVIEKERPDGLLATLGGQAGLNLAVKLEDAGVLEKFNVKVLGTSTDAVRHAEDRDLFKKAMEAINEPVAQSMIVEDVDSAVAFAKKIGFPVIVRPAYTLGGEGGGFANSTNELIDIAVRGLKASMIGQVLIEKSLFGYKEIEYEVMRDANDNCICICNMENIDPVGVHTGDSVVVAPTQTLSDVEAQMLRSASIKIIRALKIEGGCNIQFALDPHSQEYFVIEVNPRVSRSSALASKATGYPIAKVSAKIAAGLTLDEITNDVTGKTKACFEPSIDYCVIKYPRWPFDKFYYADKTLGTQMKATGEVMAIDRKFEAALLKAIRSLEIGANRLYLKKFADWSDEKVVRHAKRVDDERLFAIAEAFRRGVLTVDEIADETLIDRWFLNKIKNIADIENKLRADQLSDELLIEAKKIGLPDAAIAELNGGKTAEIRRRRHSIGLLPHFKMVDTCAAEFDAQTPYLYSTYNAETSDALPSAHDKVIVLGSGPIRIGQGVEFDYCSVRCVRQLQKLGKFAIIINNNPETVSTDFDTSDRLYFEPLTLEDVQNIIEYESKDAPLGVIAQFGGQTAINLGVALDGELDGKDRYFILGTSIENINRAEDRDAFDNLCEGLDIPRPKGAAIFTVEEALNAASRIGYPLMVRPSYVLGGRAMQVVYNDEELTAYVQRAIAASDGKHPVFVDRYLPGTELDVDAVSDGDNVLIGGIMQHVERAGVHSGDSIAVFPPLTVDKPTLDTVTDYTTTLARALNVKGLLNIQFVIADGKVFVLEVNPRSSRTIPFISKAAGIDLVDLATQAAIGFKLGQSIINHPKKPYYAVKVPVFSLAKMQGVEVGLGPEMRSTGEVVGLDYHFSRALYKGLLAAGTVVPVGELEAHTKPCILFTVADRDKDEAVKLAAAFAECGFDLAATEGTRKAFDEAGIKSKLVGKVHQRSADIIKMLRSGLICMVVNTLSDSFINDQNSLALRDGFKIRRAAVEIGVPCLTSLDTANAVLDVVQFAKDRRLVYSLAIQDYLGGVHANVPVQYY